MPAVDAHDHDDAHEHGAGGHEQDAGEPRHDHGRGGHGAGEHGPDHDGHDHGEHGHDHDGAAHEHRGGGVAGLLHAFRSHSHDAGDRVDAAMESSRAGLRTVWVTFAVLLATAVIQALVVALSGSVALLGDTLHNAADACTAAPLAIAFTVGRRPATRRHTYGYGRAEDVAGIAVVALIAASSAAACAAAVGRLLHPAAISRPGIVALAAVVGFAGNESVAQYRIRVGRRIGSAALVADGMHARTDGFTSLAVLAGAGGSALGWTLADPVVGLLIASAILVVLRAAAREVLARLMDAVDPELVDQVEATLRDTPGVIDAGEVHVRWIGHTLRAECEITVDSALGVVQAHALAHDAEHRLLHGVRPLGAAIVHANPEPSSGLTHHEATEHHRTDARG